MKPNSAMNFIRQSAFIISIAALIIFIACKRTIGGIDRDTPPLPSGNQYISLAVATTDGSTLPSYTVSITAPDGSTSTESGSEAEFIIDPITSGTYSITISTDAGTHIGQTKEIVTNVPADNSADYAVGTDFYLTTKNAPDKNHSNIPLGGLN